MAKGWTLVWKATHTAMLAEPLELSIEKSVDPPSRVRIEVRESDARKHEVDDYDDNLEERTKDEKDDLIATFEGTLTSRTGSQHGSLFQFESGGPHLAKTQANDHVVITFEGSSKKFECGVPHDPGDEPVDGDSDGGFYEVYAQIFDASSKGGEPLATTHVHLVRRRTDLLLKVEPLNQCGATLSNAMGKMVLKFFHEGNTATQDREWGEIIIGTYDGNPTSKTICSSGCNYTVLAMALRYLRKPKPGTEGETPAAKEWITIFDDVIEADLDDAYKPFAPVSEFPMLSVSGQEIETLSKSLFEKNKKVWKRAPKLDLDDAWQKVPPGTELTAMLACRKEATIKKHWWVPKLVWWVRKQESGGKAEPADVSDTVATTTTSWLVEKKDKTTERIDATRADGTRIAANRMTSMTFGTFVASSGRAEPPYEPEMRKRLGIKVTQIGMYDDNGRDWDKRLEKHLRRGLPAVAHVKSGRYLKPGANGGGHYILIVGYRKTGGVLRFIANDPAGSKKLQYECLREQDVAVTEATRVRQYLTSLKVSFVLTREGEELGRGDANFVEDELVEAQRRTFPERTIGLSGGIKVNIVSEGGSSPTNGNSFGAFQYSVEVLAGGNPALTVSSARADAKQKSGSATGAASHRKDALKIDLAFHGKLEKKLGLRLAESWEGRFDGLVERRRHDSCFALHLIEPTFAWEEGAAQWLVFDGKAH
jgi:hypothetical protein